jgi:hypothetical protein
MRVSGSALPLPYGIGSYFLQGYFNFTVAFKSFQIQAAVGYAAVGHQVKKDTQDRP